MMAFVSHSYRRSSPIFTFTFVWRETARPLRFGRTAAGVIFLVLPLLAAWYLGATAYFVFHDQLLASLISRQAETQYAYEDRIAVLKTQLDRQTSRSLVDRQTLATTIHDLASRSAQLEAHAVMIDGVVRGLTHSGRGSNDVAIQSASPKPLPDGPGAYDLQSPSPGSDKDGDQSSVTDPQTEDHVELEPEAQSRQLSAFFDRVAARQSEQVALLRDPMVRAVGRLQTALAETGLSASRWGKLKPLGDVGGPFVPLPEDAHATGFEQNIALLQDAVAQHARLTGIVASVPLRRPVEGRIEVTSPFGPRLDPFFGRPAMHTGMDLMEAYGGPVLATAGGVVTVAGSEGGYGNMVEIDHGNGLVTRYGHLSSVDVVPHQRVSAGALVGRVGSTGRATGPHLHYETRIDGEPVDPSRFLRAGSNLFRG